MNRGGGGGGRKVLLPPINFIFKLLQQHSTVQIWLYEQLAIRIEGRIRVCNPVISNAPQFTDFSQGFDEFMNLVIDDAVEVKQATKTQEESRRQLGKSHFSS
jgi:small nuclear ribonucleoprotein E